MHADALHLLGCVASKAGRLPEAEQWIRRAIAVDPRQSVFHNNLGLALLASRKIEEAIAEFHIAISLQPDSFDTFNHLGNALCDLGRFDEAVPHFQHAIAAKPTHPFYIYNLGSCWMRKGMAMRIDSDPANTQAAKTARQQVLEKAVACFRKSLLLKPDYSEAFNNLGTTFQAMGCTDDAIATWQQSVATKPHFFSYYNLGRALYEQDRVDEAEAAMQNGMRIQPDRPESYTNLGNVFRQTGMPQEAIDSFKHAINLKSFGSITHSNLLYTTYYHPDYDRQRILDEHRNWNDQRVDLCDLKSPIEMIVPPIGGCASATSPQISGDIARPSSQPRFCPATITRNSKSIAIPT